MNVAIVHDDLTQRGGAERVVLSLHRLFPDAPIYTSVYRPATTYPEFAGCDVRVTGLQRLAQRVGDPRRLLPLYPWVFGRLRLRGYDAVISSSARFAHGVRAEGGLHVVYCYSPPRFLYRTAEYLAEGSPAPAWARRFLPPVLAAMRRWDLRAAARPDVYVATSSATARRIAETYGRRAVVLHPPVFNVGRTAAGPAPSSGPYLVVSRLLPYKRVDLAVRACSERGAPLVVVGSGPAEAEIRPVAGPTVEFRHGLTDDELCELFARCRAVIQPGREDLGYAPLEANAAGRPAVALAAGGALETVVDGETGVLFPEPTVDGLHAALDRVEAQAWEPARLRAHAQRFSEERFHDGLTRILADHGVTTARVGPVGAAQVRR